MKLIIAVCGKKNYGKSSSLVQLFNSGIMISPVIVSPKNPQYEVVAYGNYKHKTNIKVGINSYGDNATHINKFLPVLINIGCEVIITASRCEGTKSFDAVAQLSLQYGYELILIGNYCHFQNIRYSQTQSAKMGMAQNLINGTNLNDLFCKHTTDMITKLL